MKYIQITIFCLLLVTGAQAQTLDSLAFQQLQQTVRQLQKELKVQKTELSAANKTIAGLQSQTESQKQTIAVLADSLGVKINETEQNATAQIVDVNKLVGKKSLFAIIGGAVLLLLSVALFVWLYRRQKTSRADIIGQLERTKSSVEERLVKEFSKQAEILQSLAQNFPSFKNLESLRSAGEPDHSLALKLADEITLMERNISLMDSGTKGLKQLNRSIGKLKDNLAANGYEIPELLGKPYNEGMKAIIVNTIQDDNLEKGVELITKIVKPQVNYQDKMIQAAQIEVSVG